MRISVISFNGAPPSRAASFDFDSRGGAIGREDGNELVLPDPERHISRVQARVKFDGGQFVLVDMGGNPSSVNDRPVGRGNRVALNGGDRIAIGGYLLEVEFAHAAPVFSKPELATPSPSTQPSVRCGNSSIVRTPSNHWPYFGTPMHPPSLPQ